MSRNTYTPPVISVSDGPPFLLMATSHERTATAGPRIFRAEPWPDVEFSHVTRSNAEAHATTLRNYLSDCASGKRKDSTKPIGRGWWQD